MTICLCVLGALMAASAAEAATQLGATFVPVSDTSSGTRLQLGSPGAPYAAPSAGVITSWSFQAPASPPQLKFKVARPAGGTSFTIIGEDGPRTPTSGMLNTYPTRIAVQAGDVLGLHNATSGYYLSGAPGYALHAAGGDQPLGATATYTLAGAAQLDVSALLEPDADRNASTTTASNWLPAQRQSSPQASA